MRYCQACKIDTREPLVRLPRVIDDLRKRGERVNVAVPEGDIHVSCITKLREKIVSREKRHAIR